MLVLDCDEMICVWVYQIWKSLDSETGEEGEEQEVAVTRLYLVHLTHADFSGMKWIQGSSIILSTTDC